MTDVDRLYKTAKQPMSKSDLARFIGQFAESLKNDPTSWENINLKDFLEAWAAWIEDIDESRFAAYKGSSGSPPWQMVAEMMLAAGTYE